MATYLPDKLNFTEYRPVMQGIPVAQANAAYDRMDRNYIMAEQDATALEQSLATAAAKAAPGDREAILSRLNQVKEFVDGAADAGELYNSVRQVKSLVRQVAGDEDYQLMVENGRRFEQFRTQYNNLVTQYGANNVTVEGDGEEFNSIDPATGERRQFMGAPSRLPDFDTTQKGIWEKNTDYVSSFETVRDFVEMGGAFNAYLGTPEGRTELDYVARQGFGIPYTRLSEEQQMAVNEVINNKLMNAGFRMVKTAQQQAGVVDWDSDKYKAAAKHGITVSGVNSNTYSRNQYNADGVVMNEDGEPKPYTDTIVSIHDGLNFKDSEFQRQMLGLIESDNVVDFYKTENTGHFEPSQGALNLNEVDHVRMTTALSPNGKPLMEVRMKNDPTNPDAEQAIVRYVELQDKDMELVRGASEVFMAQLRTNTDEAQRKAAYPAIASMYPYVTNWLTNGEIRELTIPGTAIKVTKQDGVFLFHDPTNPDSPINNHRATSDTEVRTKIGAVILGAQNN
jgi:hypothetical protein